MSATAKERLSYPFCRVIWSSWRARSFGTEMLNRTTPGFLVFFTMLNGIRAPCAVNRAAGRRQDSQAGTPAPRLQDALSEGRDLVAQM